MESLVGSTDLLLSVLTVVGQIIIACTVLFFVSTGGKGIKKLRSYFPINKLVAFAFVVSLLSMLGSLFYSEIAGFTPCVLCWYQRIAMYPLVIILGMSLWRKEWSIFPYVIMLSVIGLFFSVYQYLLQIEVIGKSISCSLVGYSVSCAETFTMNFGYITIPVMAGTAFVLIILSLFLARR